MAATRFEIEKFDGEKNFNLWQVRMMAILVQTGLKKVITGKKPENLNQIEWKELDEKALSAIHLCLANTVLLEVLMEKTSSALWKRLETIYATKSLANRLVLKQFLFKFRMNKCELLRYHISQFITLLNDLKNVEVHIDDEDQATLLLCCLPLSYKSFRETLIYGRDKLSFEYVKGYLLSRDKLDNEFGLDRKADRQPSVLVASNKRDKKCRYCKRLGYVKADCYKLRNKRAAESNEEDVAGANLADEGGDDFLEWFSTYGSVEGGVVYMGNDSSSKVIGIGTVKIRIHDGMIRTLSDVRYVPDLQKNLISLSILDLKGCRINIESSGIKVSRGALILLKGKRTCSFYILERSTVAGEIGRPSSVTVEVNSFGAEATWS
ncbi:hypothetical protein CXB51_024797 [Gossypium anomalum]|uniref:Retrovirus-related Pol polyprotein from transposon TNT 1-94-like beta-barrel domain-containing protein n=1 Tax=Gossypium anomalum TaxID=47600 RepID=A0A8J6CR40_9ROSI|nr:hypothetical protein CXB51_024797 [Gossypium anomalum]